MFTYQTPTRHALLAPQNGPIVSGLCRCQNSVEISAVYAVLIVAYEYTYDAA